MQENTKLIAPSSVYCSTEGTADIFTITVVSHSCEKEAFRSSLGIITGSNPLPKVSKADISLSLYTLSCSTILARFTTCLNRGQPYCEARLTLLRNQPLLHVPITKYIIMPNQVTFRTIWWPVRTSHARTWADHMATWNFAPFRCQNHRGHTM